MSCHIVYMTTGSVEQAREISRTLVGERLAACANLLPRIESIYWWADQLQEDQEWAVLLKTTGEKLDELTARAKQLHEYECPCIVSWPLSAGNADYFDWLTAQTAAE